MGNKQLERKIDVMLTEDTVSGIKDFSLEYYLLESIAGDLDELTGKEIFGIEIVKKNGQGVETAKVSNISCSREYTGKILDKLAANEVTPVTLKYIIEDIVSEA